jgi:Fur family transcriptional regulator, peroxide stress response regulator
MKLKYNNYYFLKLIFFFSLPTHFYRWNVSIMADPQIRLQQMILKLKDHNFRITPQRLAVLKVLAASKDHPSVDRTYEQVKKTFPTTSLATIYKTIALLKEMHEVLEIRFSEGSRFDGNKPYPHPHVICLECKKIIDPDLMGLGQLTEEAARRTRFRIMGHRLDFFGICPECQAKE